jgi:hypothetical protein
LLTASEKLRAEEAEQLEAAERKTQVRTRTANGRSYRRGGTEAARGI